MLFSCSRRFLDDLRDRLQEWGPAHCVGEIFIKFGSQLNTYTNFFNNYPVVLKTIEKVTDGGTIQAFIRPSELARTRRTRIRRKDFSILGFQISSSGFRELFEDEGTD